MGNIERKIIWVICLLGIFIYQLRSDYPNKHRVFAEPEAWFLVDNFSTLNLGSLDGQNGWRAEPTGIVSNDPSGNANRVIQMAAGADDEFIRKSFPVGITDNSSGTLFFRVYRESGIDIFIGTAADSNASTFNQFETQLGKRPTDGADWTIRDGKDFRRSSNTDGFPNDEWICVWMDINNL